MLQPTYYQRRTPLPCVLPQGRDLRRAASLSIPRPLVNATANALRVVTITTDTVAVNVPFSHQKGCLVLGGCASDNGVVNVLEDRWSHMLKALVRYRAEHSNADVPRSYVTAEGDRLGAWLHRQRTLAEAGTLHHARRKRLDHLGVRWVLLDRAAGINAFRQFVEIHGHGLVPHTYQTTDGLALGVWVQSRRRQWKSDPVRAVKLWPELEALGFTWVVRDLAQQWETGLKQLQAYQAQRGDTLVPVWFVTPNGFALGRWVDTRRAEYRAGTLSHARVTTLAEVGMVWSVRGTPDPSSRRRREDAHFGRMLNRTVSWVTEHGGALPSIRDQDTSGLAVGRWLGRQRRLGRVGRLDESRREDLNEAIPGWSSPPRPSNLPRK